MSSQMNIRYNIDYASNYRVLGWAVDIATNSIPRNMFVSHRGQIISLSQLKSIFRPDVCEALGLSNDIAVGFDINLLDLFNDRTNEYAILAGGSIIWSFENYLDSLDQTVAPAIFLPPQEVGSRQIIICTVRGDWLETEISRILAWNPTYFNKGYHSGISFHYMDVLEISKFKEKFLGRNPRGLIICTSDAYQNICKISPSLVEKYRCITLNRYLNLELDFNGLLSVVCALANIKSGTEMIASRLVQIFNSLSGYVNLHFDAGENLFFLQGGKPEAWMAERLRADLQGHATEDVLLFIGGRRGRLSELRWNEDAVFVQHGALRKLLDLLHLPPQDFLKAAWRRGATVRQEQMEVQ